MKASQPASRIWPISDPAARHVWQVAFVIAIAAACAFVGCNSLPRHEEFSVGLNRSALRERFGEPTSSQQMRKTDNAVFGPIEDFWSRVPMGSTVEIWTFRTTQATVAGNSSRQTGSTEVYFVDGSDEASALGFAPDGVVY